MTTRPSTSRPRGKCSFYHKKRGCINGRTCKFLHDDDTLSPYDQAKTCRFYAAGYCKRGASCWFQHVLPEPQADSKAPLPVEEDICGICLEIPVTFGLLSNCGHRFCLECIRGWRGQKNSVDYSETHITKRCPYCRTLSDYVFPSSHFYPHEHPDKDAALKRYKESVSRIPCKYFSKSSLDDRFCPFGRDCLYQHLNTDGTPYTFPRGVSFYMPQLGRRGRQFATPEPDTLPFHHREELRNFFNDVRVILDSIRPLVVEDGPEPVPGGDITPTAAEHLLEVLAATELAVAELWASESSRAPSPEPPPLMPMLVPRSPTPPPPRTPVHPLPPPASPIVRPRAPRLVTPPARSPAPSPPPAWITLFEMHEDEHAEPPRPLDDDVSESESGFEDDGSDEFLSAASTADDEEFMDASEAPMRVPSAAAPELELQPDNGDVSQDLSLPRRGAVVAPPSGVSNTPTPCAESPAQAPRMGPLPEPPFMTDGRGRVVWSRTGAKDGATEARVNGAHT